MLKYGVRSVALRSAVLEAFHSLQARQYMICMGPKTLIYYGIIRQISCCETLPFGHSTADVDLIEFVI
jgi:hypothetical protein